MAPREDAQSGAAKRERPVHWAHPVNERRRLARARRRRRWRIGLVVLFVLVGGVTGAWLYLTSDERVEQFAESYLEELLGTHVGIQRASFSLTEGLVLEKLTVNAPPPFQDPILVADRVDLRIDPLALLRMKVDVKEVVVHRPLMTLVLWDEEVWNFQAMARARVRPPAVPARPVIALEDGTLRIRRKIVGETVYEHQMKASGLLIPNEADPYSLRFQTDVSSEQLHLSVTSGLLDLTSGLLRFEGQASNILLRPELYKSLPREVQRVWDRFEPTGSINLKVTFDEQDGFRLRTEMTGVSFQYAYQGLVHRFENLTGRATFSAAALRLEEVQGLLDGSPMRLEGTVAGFDGERLSLDLSVVAENILLEEHRQAVLGIAPHFERLYERYAPKGLVDVEVKIQRQAEPDARPRISGVVWCRDVEMTYSGFPYRAERLRGAIRFSPDEYRVEGLEGFHGGAPLRITGIVTNPGPAYGADFTFEGRRVPLDEDLRQALSEASREVYDLYQPSGLVDLEARVTRPPVEGERLRTVVAVKLLDGAFTYAGLPYRMTEAKGDLVISPERTEICGVRGRHGKAELEVAGEIAASVGGAGSGAPAASAAGSSPPAVHLKITGRDVPLDEDLEAALPPRQRKIYQAFHLSGLADIEGTVERSPETGGQLAYDLTIHLKGARMIYDAFPFLAENVTGQVRLTPDAARIDSLSGYNSGARIQAAGWIEHRPDDFALDLEIEGTDVPLGEQLRGALGPEVRTAWGHLDPQGRVDVKAHLRKGFGPEAPLRPHVWVTARDLEARLDVFPLPLEHVAGVLEFEDNEVRLHELRARSGPTELVLGGRILYGQGRREIDLRLQSRNLRLEGPLRRAVPEALGRAMDRLGPTGRVDLALDRFAYRATEGGAAEATWSGTALLDEVALKPGVRVSGVVGTARMQGRWAEGRLALGGRLWVQQGRIADKEVANMTLVFDKAEALPRLEVRTIEGECYGGRLEGRASISVGGGPYGFTLSAMGVDFERLLREGYRMEHGISGGRLRGTLALQARGPEGRDLFASGMAYITEAELYELPLLVRVLNVLRLAPADRTAFRQAEVHYFVRGRRVILEDIRLQGPAISLYGAGTVEPGGGLHLTFMTGKKDAKPLLGALSELVEGFRRELGIVQVTGTLAEPQVEVRMLSGLTAPLRELIELVRESRRMKAS